MGERPSSWIGYDRYQLLLLVALLIVVVALGIAPKDRADWALENGLLVIAIAVLVATHRALPLSRISYTLIFVFACLHSLGAHYTYSEVPYDEWFTRATGHTLSSVFGWERNHYDRLVHFCYGLLLAYPTREVFLRVAAVRGFWGYYLPLDVTMATSMIYELIEWAAAELLGGELGQAYLGSQGDQWDAQKDMALATLGACIAMLVTGLLNVTFQRDFAREWADSLRVKDPRPLGEVALDRMIRTR